jgi:nucleotide-binding universal stress UspA family protein
MKNILVPTDFSQNSEIALEYAQFLFSSFECNFFLLHVDSYLNVQGESFVPIQKTKKPDYTKPAKELLQELLDRTKTKTTNKKHSFHAIYEYGFFIESVKKQLDEKEIDLIAMGTKGVSGLREKVVGSSAGDVITKVQHNTLVIPNNVVMATPKEIAFPTDFNIFYSHNILNAITELLDLSGANLRIMHVTTNGFGLSVDQQSNKSYLQDFMEETRPNGHSFHSVTNKKVKSAIQCFVESRDADMIVMVAKNLNFIQQVLFDSIVEKISFHTKIPFYVIHD